MAHIHEKIDFTASILIVQDNKVLLHKHKKLGIWLPPGGHVELDEDPNQAALREAKEETGLDVELIGETTQYDSPYSAREIIPPRFLNRHFFDETHTHEHVDMAYFARPVGGSIRAEVEGADVRWFTAEEIVDDTYEIVKDVRAHALAALRELAQ